MTETVIFNEETGSVLGNPFSGASALYRNLETYPGQVYATPPLMMASAEGKQTRKQAVRAARHVERFSEHIRGGIDQKADMVVGATLRVHAQPDWDTLGLNEGRDGWKTKKPFAQACQRVFNNWANDSRCLCDAEGHYNFGGLMWLAYRHMAGPDGETAGVIHYDEARAEAYNHPWATFITVLDPDRIETPPIHITNPRAFEGKMLDGHNRMVGMWVRKDVPNDAVPDIDRHVFVPRETYWGRAMSWHFYMKTRGGQMRGVSTLVTILRQSGMLDKFDDAYLGAAVVNQTLATYISSAASAKTVAENLAPASGAGIGDGGWGLFEQKLGYYDKAKMRIGGTRIPVMPLGDEIKMSAVNRGIDDPSQFRNGFLREFASSVGISFEQLAHNFSETNYSSARAALLEIWRGILKHRALFTAHVASLIYAAVIEEAIAKGRIVLPPGAPPFQENRAAYTACAWTGPGMAEIDPLKAAEAIKLLLELKVTNRQRVAAERGDDYLEIWDQLEQENFEAEERDLILDVLDPGATAVEPDAGSETSASGVPKTKKKPGSGVPKDGDGDGQREEE
jgi:lambda family phage portal protein